MPPESNEGTTHFNEERDRALDRFWDHDSQGRPATAGGVDPADAATIRHLHEFDDRPEPAEPFIRQLREDLMLTHAIPVSSTPSLGVPPNGRAHRVPTRAPVAASPPVSARGWARLPIQLLAAAIVLLALGLGYRAFGPGGEDRSSTSIPAAVAPAATPAPDETLIEVVLPAELLPHGDAITGSLHDSTIAANSTAVWTTELAACCQGVRIDYLLSGSLMVSADGPVQVIRAGSGSLETIAAETDIALEPGDAMIFSNQTAAEYTNAWANQAELLTWVLFDSTTGTYDWAPIPPEFDAPRETLRFDQTIPPGPATFRLQRIELAGDTTFPVPDGVLQYGVITSEMASATPTTRDVGTHEDGSVQNFGPDPVIVYVMTLESAPADTAPATPLS
jgi:hypothetical protein